MRIESTVGHKHICSDSFGAMILAAYKGLIDHRSPLWALISHCIGDMQSNIPVRIYCTLVAIDRIHLDARLLEKAELRILPSAGLTFIMGIETTSVENERIITRPINTRIPIP